MGAVSAWRTPTEPTPECSSTGRSLTYGCQHSALNSGAFSLLAMAAARLAEYSAVYSPDGTTIVFTRLPRRIWKPFPSDMFLMASDGSNIERLTRTPNRAEQARQWKAV